MQLPTAEVIEDPPSSGYLALTPTLTPTLALNPNQVIEDPLLWLRTMADHRVTHRLGSGLG